MPFESYLVAKAPRARLRAAVERRTGPFTNEQGGRAGRDVEGCYLGVTGNASYIFAGEVELLGAASPDFVVNLSRELQTTVAALHFETVSGTYSFMAAESGRLVRLFVSASDLRQSFSMGARLPSEVTRPLESPEGLYAALASLGMPLEPHWFDAGDDKLQVDYPADAAALGSEDGPLKLRHALDDHYTRHGMSSADWHALLEPELVSTGDGGFKLRMVPKGEGSPEGAAPSSAPAPSPGGLRRFGVWLVPVVIALVTVLRVVARTASDGESAAPAKASTDFGWADTLQMAGILAVSAVVIFFARRRGRRLEAEQKLTGRDVST